jgi:hypothetical protein
VPLAVKVAGGALLVLWWLFLFRSFTDNTFLSPLVRVQVERGHRVVSTGVYRVVRHPMYLGAILMFLGAPLLVGGSGARGPRQRAPGHPDNCGWRDLRLRVRGAARPPVAVDGRATQTSWSTDIHLCRSSVLAQSVASY